MNATNLTQVDADELLAMGKRRLDSTEWDYPAFGKRISIPLVSADKREQFFLDLRRGRISFIKGTYQNRARQVAVLARLDFGGPPHRNPDGKIVGPTHLHLYREGFGDKWAYPVSPDDFPNLNEPCLTLANFMEYCNITEPPLIGRGLFT